MRRISLWYTLVLTLLSALASGCATEQYSEFQGAVTRDAATAATVLPLGGQFHYRDKDVADAVTGFILGESKGVLVFVHDREKFVSNGFCVSNDAVSAVYLADWSFGNSEPWKSFISLNESKRDRSEGVHRLKGSFDVERWKSNMVRVRLAMRSTEPQPVSVNGLLTIYERQEFRPGQWFAMTLWSLGLVGPTDAKPAK